MQRQVRLISNSSQHKKLLHFSSESSFCPHLEAKREEREEGEPFSPTVMTKTLNNYFFALYSNVLICSVIHMLHYEGKSAPTQIARN